MVVRNIEEPPDEFVYDLEQRPDHTVFANGILASNCHHAASSSYLEVLDHFGLHGDNPRRDCLLVGTSATPDRFDEMGFDRIFDDVVYRYDLREAIRDGWLSDVRAWRIDSGLDLSGVSSRAGDFVESQLSEAVLRSRMNEAAAETWMSRCRGRRSLFFCVDKAHARKVEEALRKRGGKVALVVDETPRDERRAVLDLFRAGELEALVNVGVLSEGYDEPATECVHILRPTKSRPLYTQILGRGTRRTETKSHVEVYDYTGHCLDVCSVGAIFGLPDAWEMAGQSAPQDADKLEQVEAEMGLKVDGATSVADLFSRVRERRVDLIKGAISDSGLPSRLAWIRPSRARERWVISWRNETEAKADRLTDEARAILSRMRLFGVYERIEIFRNELGVYEAQLKRSGPAGANTREGKMDSDRSLTKLVARVERMVRERRPHKVQLLRKDARWSSEPSSDPQRKVLLKKGVPEWLFGQLSKREASALINIPGDTVRQWFEGMEAPRPG